MGNYSTSNIETQVDRRSHCLKQRNDRAGVRQRKGEQARERSGFHFLPGCFRANALIFNLSHNIMIGVTNKQTNRQTQ